MSTATAIIGGRQVAVTGKQIAGMFALREKHSPAATMAAARKLTACLPMIAARPAPAAHTLSLAEVRKQGRARMARLCRSMGLEPNLPLSDR